MSALTTLLMLLAPQSAVSAQAPAVQAPASIERIVVEAGTTDPIPGVSVELSKAVTGPPPNAVTGPSNDVGTVTTGDDGKFTFTGIAPGTYRIVATRSDGAFTPGESESLERLARYCARPPIAVERLEGLTDDRLLYRFKRPWRDGTTHIVMEPLELLEKLSALVPAPRAHLVRYSGVFAPAAKWRALVIPESSSAAASPFMYPEVSSDLTTVELPLIGIDLNPDSGGPVAATPIRHGRNYVWAELMKRVWEIDVLECPRCFGRMRIVAAIHSPDATRKIRSASGFPHVRRR